MFTSYQLITPKCAFHCVSRFYANVVTDSLNMAFRDEDDILDQIDDIKNILELLSKETFEEKKHIPSITAL